MIILQMNELKAKEGFTLIEVIVSLAIIGISIVTIFQLLGGLRSIKVSDDYLRAAILAQNKMNELKSKSNIFTSQKGVFEEDDRYYWSLSVEDYDLSGLHLQFKNLQHENIEKSVFVDNVRLKVFWNTEHGQREMELFTLKTSTTVSPSSKDMMQGKYPSLLTTSRAEQFSEQNLLKGQSKKGYAIVRVRGRKLLLEKPRNSGAKTSAK